MRNLRATPSERVKELEEPLGPPKTDHRPGNACKREVRIYAKRAAHKNKKLKASPTKVRRPTWILLRR